jgi:hypothetical protein
MLLKAYLYAVHRQLDEAVEKVTKSQVHNEDVGISKKMANLTGQKY